MKTRSWEEWFLRLTCKKLQLSCTCPIGGTANGPPKKITREARLGTANKCNFLQLTAINCNFGATRFMAAPSCVRNSRPDAAASVVFRSFGAITLSIASFCYWANLFRFEATSMQPLGFSRSVAAPGSPFPIPYVRPFAIHTINSSAEDAAYLVPSESFPVF